MSELETKPEEELTGPDPDLISYEEKGYESETENFDKQDEGN